MSQEALQGFDLAPSLFLSRLHDTGLEPTHCPLAVVPTDTVPIERVMKGRTSSRLCIRMCWWSRFYRHLLFLLSRSPILLVMRIPDGSLPAFAWGSSPICPITGQRSLSPSSSTRLSIGPPYEELSPVGERRAYHVPLPYPDGLGPACSPVRMCPR